MAAKAPPNRWPLVPPATGKLIIWAAKIKAVVKPNMGARRIPKAVCDRSKATNKAAALAKLVTAATGTETNPSGMCIKTPIFVFS
jgi:hypothetical protein